MKQHNRWTLHGDIFCIENKDLRDRLWGACKRKLEK